jgi:hypothetical protein
MTDKRKFFVTHRWETGKKRTHIIHHSATHTLCGEPTIGNMRDYGFETIRMSIKAKSNCVYCLNNLAYYEKFMYLLPFNL